MNKALKKYGKSHYKSTRYAKMLVARIKFLRCLYAGQTLVFGHATVATISASFAHGSHNKAAKAVAMAGALTGCYASIADMYANNPLPKWCK